jgi:hypothetical protein
MDDTNKCYPRASGFPSFIAEQVFAVISGPNLEDQADFDTILASWQSNTCGPCNRLHRLNLVQYGVLRLMGPPPTITSLTRREISDVMGAGSAGTEARSYPGQLPYLISVQVAEGSSYAFRASANQAIEVYGACIQVHLLGPTNAVIVGSGTRDLTIDETSYTFDGIAAPDIQLIDEPLTDEFANYVQLVGVPGGTQVIVDVPQRATSVEISTVGAVTSFAGYVGDPSVGVSRQTQIITFTAGQATAWLGNETTIQTDSAVAGRLIEFKWKIKV